MNIPCQHFKFNFQVVQITKCKVLNRDNQKQKKGKNQTLIRQFNIFKTFDILMLKVRYFEIKST